MPSPVRRMGLDPGLSTGWAIFQGTSIIDSGSIEGGVDGFIEWWREGNLSSRVDEVVYERFIPQGFKGLTQTHSLQVEGALFALWQGPRVGQLRTDKATLIKQHDTGDKGERERKDWLASKGLHFETKHAMDAATHILVERKKARDMAFWKRYWK
jgi:hypothetical protein